jgi:NAD-reducing hydrogenase small subunit
MDTMTRKVRFATVWLDGCSGCHMSLLDVDEAIISLAQKIDILYSPLVDAQEFPDNVDVTLVEGAVSSQDDLSKIQKIRQRTKTLVALGDCAVTGNVPSMRNGIPVSKLLERIYVDGADERKLIPGKGVPALLEHARPVHEFVNVDFWLPGCPPTAKAILELVTALVEGRKPEASQPIFG